MTAPFSEKDPLATRPVTRGVAADQAETGDRRWLVGVWLVVASFVAVTAVWSQHVGIPFRDPGGTMFVRRLLLSLLYFGVLCVLQARIRVGPAGWTVDGLSAELRRRWPKERLAIALSGLLAYHVVYVCYRNLKSWDAFNGDRDDALQRVDRWLFLAHSPAVLLHDVLGEHVAAYVLAVVYESFSYIVPVSYVAALVFAPRIRDGYVFLTSSMWAWIVGVGSYYLIPSIGPFHTAAQEFAGLSRTVITRKQEVLMLQRAHLLEDPSAGDAFASVSAFASLHVGFTFTIVLMLRYYGLRRSTQIGMVYLVAVILSTIYFGYHFVLDDIGGILLGFLAVMLGHLTIYPRGRPAPTRAETRI